MNKIFDYNRNVLPYEIARLAWERYSPTYSLQFKGNSRLSSMFDWDLSEERFKFWEDIDEGDYEGFYKRYPTSVDNYSII